MPPHARAIEVSASPVHGNGGRHVTAARERPAATAITGVLALTLTLVLNPATAQPVSPVATPAPTLAASPAQRGPITLRDDQGHEVTLAGPARRAITAAPHATELVYAAGAGAYLVGTSQGGDYPPEARALPSIGSTLRPNVEIAVALQPDLLITWQPTHPDPLGDMMQRSNVPVFFSDPRTLNAIPNAVQSMGRLFGTQAHADPAAQALRTRLAALSARYTHRTPVRVFIQAGLNPLYTVNGQSIISDAVRLCGGVNVFADTPVLAPQIALESVMAAQPQAIVAGAIGPNDAALNLHTWQQHGLPAAHQGHVFSLDADALYRPGPRMIDMAQQLCEHLDKVRH